MAGREAAPRQLGDEVAQQRAALPGGIDGQHLQHLVLARADGHERPALEDADEVLEGGLEEEPLRLRKARARATSAPLRRSVTMVAAQ